jgi:uncharacterized protein YifN (PemK superfamily)
MSWEAKVPNGNGVICLLMWSIDAVQAVVVVSDPLISNNGVIVLPMTKVRNSERITHNSHNSL